MSGLVYVAYEVRVFHRTDSPLDVQRKLEEFIKTLPVDPDYPCDPMDEVSILEHAEHCDAEWCGGQHE